MHIPGLYCFVTVSIQYVISNLECMLPDNAYLLIGVPLIPKQVRQRLHVTVKYLTFTTIPMLNLPLGRAASKSREAGLDGMLCAPLPSQGCSHRYGRYGHGRTVFWTQVYY